MIRVPPAPYERVVQWRSNSESDEWVDDSDPMTQEKINLANGFYGWTKCRAHPDLPDMPYWLVSSSLRFDDEGSRVTYFRTDTDADNAIRVMAALGVEASRTPEHDRAGTFGRAVTSRHAP